MLQSKARERLVPSKQSFFAIQVTHVSSLPPLRQKKSTKIMTEIKIANFLDLLPSEFCFLQETLQNLDSGLTDEPLRDMQKLVARNSLRISLSRSCLRDLLSVYISNKSFCLSWPRNIPRACSLWMAFTN